MSTWRLVRLVKYVGKVPDSEFSAIVKYVNDVKEEISNGRVLEMKLFDKDNDFKPLMSVNSEGNVPVKWL